MRLDTQPSCAAAAGRGAAYAWEEPCARAAPPASMGQRGCTASGSPRRNRCPSEAVVIATGTDARRYPGACMDYSLYRDINGLSGHSFADGLFKFLANELPAILVVLVAATFLIPWAHRRAERRSGAVLATASAGLGLLINQPIGHAVNRLRPYLAHPGHSHLLISRSHDPSFPSDHATGAFALAVGIWLYDRTIGTVLLVLAAALCFSRVYVGT